MLSFNRPHHQRIAQVLAQLDTSRLASAGALFGGGTLLALLFDEFRLSRDIDFVCPVGPCYRRLRECIHQHDAAGLFRSVNGFTLPRGARADQYGVRFPVVFEQMTIKVELFCEARIELDPPEAVPGLPVDCLSLVDRFAEKLLANADRGGDDSVEARDLIDLAMLRHETPVPPRAVEKAQRAYGVVEPLKKAIDAFQRRAEFRERCFGALEIGPTHIRRILRGLELLAVDFGLPPAPSGES